MRELTRLERVKIYSEVKEAARKAKNEYQRKWYAAHKGKATEYMRRCKSNHPERIRQSRRIYAAFNREKIRAYMKEWRKRNPGYNQRRIKLSPA